MHPAVAWAVLALAIAGCANGFAPAAPANPPRAAAEPASAPVTAPAEPASAEPAAPREAPEPSPASQPTSAVTGAIQRTELDRVLKRGPQRFIQSVRVRPVFRQGRFVGWRVLAYAGPGPIEVGDVVMRVNGGGLEKPEHFMAVWERLDKQPELVVEMIRGRKRLTLRYPIVD